MINDNQRPARTGELCTCGRPAVIVYVFPGREPVPFCGQSEV